MNTTRSPLAQTVPPSMLGGGATPMMVTRRERAAIGAMAAIREAGGNPLPTHYLVNGLSFVAPDTGRPHGPETREVAQAAHDLDVIGDLLRPDCGCGWGKLCDGPRHAGRCVCRWQQVARDDMAFGPGDLRYAGYPDPEGIPTFDSGRMHGPFPCTLDASVLAAHGLFPADLCPCGRYRIGDGCAPR
jgi:hypothetical protein